MKHILLTGLALALIASPAVAFAQPAPARDPSGHRVFRSDDVIVVHGAVQRPYAFDIPGRGSLGYQYLDDRRTFTQDVLEPLRRAPF